MKSWLLAVTTAALAVALAQALTPEGTIKRIGGMAGRLVLLLAVLRPLPGWTGEGWKALAPEPDLTAAQAAGQSGEEVLKILIAQKAGAYIVDKGQALDLPCRAEVTVAEDASGWPVPWEVTVTGDWTAQQKRELSRTVERDLGVPPERQSFRKEGI